jgi:FtsP/CotA-like multicopper oxidase with cupredoxin domain
VHPRLVRVALVVLLFAGLVLLVAGCGTEEEASGDDGIELGGMHMSTDDLREMTRESMGVDALQDVEIATGEDAPGELPSTLEDGKRIFELEAAPVRWEYRSGQRVAAWAYDGRVPGPVLRAREGEQVVVRFRNRLPQPTTVHWHGVDVPWRQDGVPGVTQEAVAAGEDFEYEFTATPAGTRWYHTHGSRMGDESTQLDMGLKGAIVIEPRRQQAADVDQVLVLDDWQIGPRGYNAAMMMGPGHGAGHAGAYNVFTINGKAAPDIADIVVREGDTVRLRLVNASTMSIHPMHLHGHQFRIVALDGNPVPRAAQVTRNVVSLQPGETADIEFVADNPGVWVLHCHELHHADAGMMMLVRYEGYEPVGDHGEDGDVQRPGAPGEHGNKGEGASE